MQLTKEIDAAPQVVWDALSDPVVLRQCLPGCEEMTGNAQDGFTAVVTGRVGPLRLRISGTMRLTEAVPGRSCTILGAGSTAIGSAQGVARVTLEPFNAGTRLSYAIEAGADGSLARLAGGVIDSVALKLANRFFERFRQTISTPPQSGVSPPPG